MLLDFSCTDAAEPSGVFDSLVVVTLDGGLTITTGGLTTVVFVTVSLDAAGTVVTVLSDSVVCDHALPAKPTATPIAAAEIHNPRDFIFVNLMLSDQLFRKSPRYAYTLRHRASFGRCQSDELLSCTKVRGMQECYQGPLGHPDRIHRIFRLHQCRRLSHRLAAGVGYMEQQAGRSGIPPPQGISWTDIVHRCVC